MFGMSIETTVIITGVALWFAHGWYLNLRLQYVHKKLDAVLAQFNGLREYLYEIDPQFDDERQSQGRFDGHQQTPESNDVFSGLDASRLEREKRKSGKRTLNTGFTSGV